MVDGIGILVIAILFSLTGCPFPDSIVIGFLAVTYYHVRMLRSEK